MTQDKRLDYLINKLKEESVEYQNLKVGDSIDEKRKILRALMNIRMPNEIDKNILAIQDEYLVERAKEKGLVDLNDIKTIKKEFGINKLFSDKISIWKGDITRLNIDAIVNAANSQMLGCFVPMHTCIDNCIHTFAGMQLRLECNEKMNKLRSRYGNSYEYPTAVPMLTNGYNLPTKKVIHIVGPIVQGSLNEEHKIQLSDCYRNTLDMCRESGLKSVAFCCISTGIFNFPNEQAAEIATKTVIEWLHEHSDFIERVIFNVFTGKDENIYRRLLAKN